MFKKFEDYLYQDDLNKIPDYLIESIKKTLIEIPGSLKDFSIDEKIVIKIIYLNANEPFIKQQEIANILNLNKKTLITYNNIIKNVPDAQKIISEYGVGSKFFKNTIFPVIQSGSLDAYINKKKIFPFKVGLFPGLSCMFKCTFCGRNYDAVYDRKSLDAGTEMYTNLIKEAPKNDSHRFYIAGGLEPLTNPKIGKLINDLSNEGFKSSMYTNAYMLTEKYLNKNQELFNLDYLRISVYGTDNDDYLSTTRHPKGFEQVFNNIPEYIKLKISKNSKTKLGINYIILKKYTEKLETLINNIIKINKIVGLKKNNFDFLTLREDFSIHQDRYEENDKKRLSQIFKKINKEIANNVYLKNLYVDYGFALEGLNKGYLKKSLANSFVTNEEFKNLGVPHSSVVVDLYGDVYMFREAGFLDRPGAKRYIIGNLFRDGSMENIINKFNDDKFKVDIKDGDQDYLDAWDHVVVKMANQYKSDLQFGIPFELGPFLDKQVKSDVTSHKIHYAE